jgi:prolyl-tRNA synthetase
MLIRNEMNHIGGQELSLSAIGRKTIWEMSGMNREFPDFGFL